MDLHAKLCYTQTNKSWEVAHMAEQSYELMHKDDVVSSLQLDDLSGAIKMALTVWFVSAIDLLYSFFSLRNVLPQSILDQRIQADLLRHCANRGLLVQLR